MGIEEGEGEEVQAKGIHNIFNKILTENFPNIEKLCPFRYTKPYTINMGVQVTLSRNPLGISLGVALACIPTSSPTPVVSGVFDHGYSNRGEVEC
jgi:hypothetical protein